MRDFFIRSLDKLIGFIIILMGILVIIGFLVISLDLANTPRGAPSGFGPGIVFLVLGAFYVTLVGGFMYLGVGIYQNTLRTAQAVERLLAEK